MRAIFRTVLISSAIFLGFFITQPLPTGFTSDTVEKPQPVRVVQEVKAQTSVNPIYTLVNNARLQAGLNSLTISGILINSATIRACEVDETGVWSHTRPNGTSFATTIKGFYGNWVGEDLARYYSSDTAVFTGWMASPTHREQIMKPTYRYYGLGKCGSVWALHFAQ